MKVRFGQVKAHVSTSGNEETDKKVQAGADMENPNNPVVTEGGLKEKWKQIKKENRCMKGTRGGRVVNWR